MTRYGNGYGGVDYAYNIGKYEVTAGQYTEFLNAVADDDTYGLVQHGHVVEQLTAARSSAVARRASYTYSVAARLGEPAGELRVLGRFGAVQQLAAQRPADRGAGSDARPRTGRTSSTGR